MKIPDFKKRISFFLSSEEAKALKKNIAKFGLTAAIAAGIMVQNEPAQALHLDGHEDSHYDGHNDGHNDVHSDSHNDSHSDAHSDGCIDGGYPHSSQPVYDTTNKRGGHSSHSQHDSC